MVESYPKWTANAEKKGKSKGYHWKVFDGTRHCLLTEMPGISESG